MTPTDRLCDPTSDPTSDPASDPASDLASDPVSELVSEVPRAYVTGFQRGRTHALHPPTRWMRGAVHDADGRLVPHSLRTWSRDNPNAAVAVDPVVLRRRPQATPLPGTWAYAGHWSRHFGHFLLEVLPTLWPDPPPGLSGLLAHRSFRPPRTPRPRTRVLAAEPTPWQRELLELAGYGGLPLHVVRGRPVEVERLVVASRPVVFRTVAHPPAVDLWRRIAAAAGPAPAAHGRVFLSRRRFHLAAAASRRTTPEWDAELEQAFAAHGFEVLHPEALTVTEQVRAVAGAAVLAGSTGSALHQAVFARPGTHVVEVGDARTPDHPQTSQVMVDTACGHRSSFVPHLDRAALRRTLASLG